MQTLKNEMQLAICNFLIKMLFNILFYKSFLFSFKNRLYYFKKVLGIQQNWREGTEISRIPVPSAPAPSLASTLLPRMALFLF